MKRLFVFAAVIFLSVFGCTQDPSTSDPDASALSVAPTPVPQSQFDILKARWKAGELPPPPVTAAPTQTQADIDVAACTDPKGRWVCLTPQPPKKLKLEINNAAPPASWSVPFWAVDNANTTGCASDANTCTSATCGSAGVGPCKTWAQINDVRLGCGGGLVACPQINGGVVPNWHVQFVSNDTADYIFTYPVLYNNASGEINGNTTPAGCTITTLASVTAGGPPSRTALWLAAPSTGAFSAGTFITNATHAGAAWAYKLSSGAIWQLTQPVSRTVNPPVLFTPPTELTTWANGDTITFCPTQTQVNLVKVMPTQGDFNGTSFTTWVNIHNLAIADANPKEGNTMQMTSAAVLQEVSSNRQIYEVPGDFGTYSGWYNDYFAVGFGGWADPSVPTIVFSGFSNDSMQMNQQSLDGDIILGAASMNIYNGYASPVYIGSGDTLSVVFKLDLSGTNTFTGAAGIVWGPGTLNALGRVSYAGGAGGAVATFKVTTLRIDNGGTKFCTGNPAASATTLTCNTTLTAANLDTALGSTATGCAGYVGSASGYCNP